MTERPGKRGMHRQNKEGANTVGQRDHEIYLAQKFCAQCPANMSLKESNGGSYKGFPTCGMGVNTSTMVPPGSVLETDITPKPGCLQP